MNVQRLLHYLWQNISLDESLGGGAESPTHISRPYLQGSVLKRLALMSRPKRSARLCRSAINDGHYLRSLPFKHKIKLFLSAYNYRIRKREKKQSVEMENLQKIFFLHKRKRKERRLRRRERKPRWDNETRIALCQSIGLDARRLRTAT